ncbi:MAG: thioredoxin-disulfide reductase [Candidatus Omnitrophica bacterium]|nr:thioredoxin-disulfide reductase [Candidatus Omnitrophota bacterium]
MAGQAELFDITIVGGGGAGLTAALYASRGNLQTGLFEKMVAGGQIATTDDVENYPGFPEAIAGPDIAIKMEEQAKKYGAEIIYGAVTGLERDGQNFRVITDQGTFNTRSIVLASGANPRKLNVKGEKEFAAKGVSYCATCDGALFRGKDIAVVGGGDSAIQESLFLTKFASKVTVIHRRDELRASKILQQRAFDNEKVEFIWNAVISEIKGSKKIETLQLKDTKTGALRDFNVQGLFIFIGHDPVSDYVRGLVECDDHGYVITDQDYKTNVPGIFACGEVRKGSTRQLVSACGEGCSAALAVQAYLDNLA